MRKYTKPMSERTNLVKDILANPVNTNPADAAIKGRISHSQYKTNVNNFKNKMRSSVGMPPNNDIL